MRTLQDIIIDQYTSSILNLNLRAKREIKEILGFYSPNNNAFTKEAFLESIIMSMDEICADENNYKCLT